MPGPSCEGHTWLHGQVDTSLLCNSQPACVNLLCSSQGGDVQASRGGGSQQGQGQGQDEQSPRQGEAQPDLQGIATAYAQLCAFLMQQKQPPPAVA